MWEPPSDGDVWEAQLEAGMPFMQSTSIVREPANLMILDRNRFAFSAIKPIPDDSEPESDPAPSSPSRTRDGRTSLEVGPCPSFPFPASSLV